MILYMYIAKGQGLTTPWGRNFYVNRNILSFWSFVASFKKIFSKSDYIQVFSWFYKFIASRQGQTTPKLWCQQKLLVTSVICYKFKKNLFEVWFYTILFMISHMYIAPGKVLTTPWGQNFYANRNILSLWSFVASFKQISLKSDFIQFFHDFIHVYSPGAGADSPQGTKFWCKQKGLITLPICCKFQRNLFEVWFYTTASMI